ncbi:MAG TPA: PIN domain-containing protein [Ktedonobacterales bacterium]|nr:PIN domain-containing protein [Ktedonobacterales bacterium]
MGSVTLPAHGPIYLDANCFIYSVERVVPYVSFMDEVWTNVRNRHLPIITSELTILEVLTKPIKLGDAVLEASFRTVLFASPDVRLMPITQPILERAARLRAATSLKTPDAIHAATALEAAATLFLTNDPAFRHIPGLAVTILSDLLTP